MGSRRTALGLSLIVFLIGAWLRWDSFTSSLWLDEFGTLWVVEAGLRNALERAFQFQGQSPFYYVWPWLSIGIFGESEVALRLPSLCFDLIAALVSYQAGRAIGGHRAGLAAAAMYWLLPDAVRAGVNARPYALSFACVAVTVLGFHQATLTDRLAWRALWIVGGAATVWTHYVNGPLVAGLWLAYASVPLLRRRYRPQRFVVDLLVQIALMSLAFPQLFALLQRREGLFWLDRWDYLAFLLPLGPLVPALIFGLGTGSARGTEREAVVRAVSVLALPMACQIGAIEAAAFLGINLLEARYFSATVVPTVLLAAYSISRLTRHERVAAVAAFAVTAALVLLATRSATGTFSGIGRENWRDATAVLEQLTTKHPDAPVLFRSGFVEEGAAPSSGAPAATLAPLRSPGRETLNVPVTSLTFRWGAPGRVEYYDRVVAPVVDASDVFFLLSLESLGLEGQPSYPGQFAEWIEDRWPGRFRREVHTFGVVVLIEFHRQKRLSGLVLP